MTFLYLLIVSETPRDYRTDAHNNFSSQVSFDYRTSVSALEGWLYPTDRTRVNKESSIHFFTGRPVALCLAKTAMILMGDKPETAELKPMAQGIATKPPAVSRTPHGDDSELKIEAKKWKWSQNDDVKAMPVAKKQRTGKKERTSGANSATSVASVSYARKTQPTEGGLEGFTDQDVLSGRGGGTNLHPGNRFYRDLILSHRQSYDMASKAKKPAVSRKIVQMIRDRGGRFLRKEGDGLYHDIGDEAAREKTSQALRHRTFEMRNKEDSLRKRKPSKVTQEEQRVEVSQQYDIAFELQLPDRYGILTTQYCFHQDQAQDVATNDGRAGQSSSGEVNVLGTATEGQAAFLPGIERNRRLDELQINNRLLNPPDLQMLHNQHHAAPAAVFPIRRDPAYLSALVALRQREALMDLDASLIQQAQIRRQLAMNSVLPPIRPSSILQNPNFSSAGTSGTFLLGSQVSDLGLVGNSDPNQLVLGTSIRSGLFPNDTSDGSGGASQATAAAAAAGRRQRNPYPPVFPDPRRSPSGGGD